jgi:hypothetical protein
MPCHAAQAFFRGLRMKVSTSILLLASITTLVTPGPPVNGVKIVTRQITGSFTDTRTEYLTADRLRNEWQSRMGDRNGPTMASIVQRGERDRVFVLDLQAKEYLTYETDNNGMDLGARRRNTASSGGTLQIFIDNFDTGERKEVFGHTARRIKTVERRVAGYGACSRDSESETDGWYIDPGILPKWRQPKKDAFGVVVASVISAGSADACQNKMDKLEVHRKGAEPGFPIKVTTTVKSEVPLRDGAPRPLASTWGSEVVELREGPIDPELFDVPPDFRQVQNLRTWSAGAPRHEPTGWEWFKQQLKSLFQ